MFVLSLWWMLYWSRGISFIDVVVFGDNNFIRQSCKFKGVMWSVESESVVFKSRQGDLLSCVISLERRLAYRSQLNNKWFSHSVIFSPILVSHHWQILNSRGAFKYLPASIWRSWALILNFVVLYLLAKLWTQSR